MCIIFINIHKCGHSVIYDTVTCHEYRRRVEINGDLDFPDADKPKHRLHADSGDLKERLAACVGSCDHRPQKWRTNRDYPCEHCINRVLKGTGLATEEEIEKWSKH